jgi:hypothetical protein
LKTCRKGLGYGKHRQTSFESDEGKVTYEGTLAGTQVAGVSDYGERGAGTFRGSRRR